MPSELVPIVIGVTLIVSTAYVIKVLSDNRTRRKFLNDQVSTEAIQKLFLEQAVPDYEAAFKYGLVTFGLGLAFTLIALTNLGPGDAMSYALLLLLGGGGLLVYYWLRHRAQ